MSNADHNTQRAPSPACGGGSGWGHLALSKALADTARPRPIMSGDDGYAAGAAGTGSAVTDLIFSIAKREVTFFKVTAPISFL
jgi:hypothetical protein